MNKIILALVAIVVIIVVVFILYKISKPSSESFEKESPCGLCITKNQKCPECVYIIKEQIDLWTGHNY